ncbi:hypothetical protein PoB_004502400 [Plakobranchus ocellatus]|uniref:Uncharacterized protein n=1 Tax=Plakobranchus ocellatus TaxID=259542 RepID=A0AAV4BI48_9GAST|nr:hypothetical protein PoB_004502400 [Plakobranchus ocellatus]
MDSDRISLHEEEILLSEGGKADEKDAKKDELTTIIKQNNMIMESVMNFMMRKKRKQSSSSPSSSSVCSPLPPPARKKKEKKNRQAGKEKQDSDNPKEELSVDECILEAIGTGELSTHDSDTGVPRVEKPDPPGSDAVESEIDDTDESPDWYKEASAEYEADEEVGAPVAENLARFITMSLSEPMKDEKLREKVQRYKRPKNCETITTRKTNKTIWSLLNNYQKKKDTIWASQQKTITKATIAIARSVEIITDMAKIDKSAPPKAKQAVKALTDAISFLGHVQQKITTQRKEGQRPAMPFEAQGICDMPSDGHEWCFLLPNDVVWYLSHTAPIKWHPHMSNILRELSCISNCSSIRMS